MMSLAAASPEPLRPRPRRLTQAQRSASTRNALLESTVESLVELGYERATMSEISERAGLSRGAHLHHFQTRAALLGAAVDHMLGRSQAELAVEVDALPSGARRPRAALDMLWRLYTGPLFKAILELSLPARTDPDLRPHLESVERAVSREVMPVLRHAFGFGERDRSHDDLIVMITSTVRGLALLPLLEPQAGVEKLWTFSRGRLLELVQAQLDRSGT